MSKPPVTLRLDPRRLKQLKTLANAYGLTSAATLSHLLREKIDAGMIPADIPGISIKSVPAGVRITIDDAEPVTYDKAVAGKIVAAIRGSIDGQPSVVDLDSNFGVVRRGTGLLLMFPVSGHGAKTMANAPSFPPDLAYDLAGLVEKAAA